MGTGESGLRERIKRYAALHLEIFPILPYPQQNTKFFSPNLLSPNASHHPSPQHHQALPENIPAKQNRKTGEVTEEPTMLSSPSKFNSPASSPALQLNTICSLFSLLFIAPVDPTVHPILTSMSLLSRFTPASNSGRQLLLAHRSHLPENQAGCQKNYSLFLLLHPAPPQFCNRAPMTGFPDHCSSVQWIPQIYLF